MFQRLFSVFLLVVFLTSCSSQPQTVSRKPLKVELAFWWGDFTLLVAKEKGFFEKYGVLVEPVYYESFPQAPADLAAGKIDVGLFSIGDVLIASHDACISLCARLSECGLNMTSLGFT